MVLLTRGLSRRVTRLVSVQRVGVLVLDVAIVAVCTRGGCQDELRGGIPHVNDATRGLGLSLTVGPPAHRRVAGPCGLKVVLVTRSQYTGVITLGLGPQRLTSGVNGTVLIVQLYGTGVRGGLDLVKRLVHHDTTLGGVNESHIGPGVTIVFKAVLAPHNTRLRVSISGLVSNVLADPNA